MSSSGSRRAKPASLPSPPPSTTPRPSRLRSMGRHTPARQGRSQMGVLIVREMVGTSQHSWSDAARQAVALASKTVRNIRTIEVVQSTARVEGGEIVEYRVQIKLGFEYEE